MALPPEERFGFEVDLSMPEDYTASDKALTIGIAVMMVLSGSLLVYIIAFPREGEHFTEFFVLGKLGKADDYPRFFEAGAPQRISIGIGNHEGGSVNFTVVLTLGLGGSNRTAPNLDDVNLTRSENPAIPVTVGNGKTILLPANFSIPDPGSYKVQILLFRDGKQYRDLHIWVKCFARGTIGSPGPGMQFFITGPGGDPATVGMVAGGSMTLGVGWANGGSDRASGNVTMRIGEPRTYGQAQAGNGTWTLAWDHGLFLRMDSEAGSTAYQEVSLGIQGRPDNITVDLRSGPEHRVTLRLKLSGDWA
jgi:hypothetical protein